MSATEKPLFYGDEENAVPLSKEQNPKLSASSGGYKQPSPNQQRAVLQDLSLNTIRQPIQPDKTGGGGGNSPASTPVVSKPEHEANVQFAREFVVELVETVPKKSEKEAVLFKNIGKEDVVSLKSACPSEDTDTTEYESAAETDPLDAASPIGSLIAEDILTSFQEALDKKYPPSEKEAEAEGTTESPVVIDVDSTSKTVENTAANEHPFEKEELIAESPVEPVVSQKVVPVEDTAANEHLLSRKEDLSSKCPVEPDDKSKVVTSDKSPSQVSDPSPLSEVYEDAGDTEVKTNVEEVKPLDISGLCLCINNLCLDSPRKGEEGELPVQSKKFENTLICDIPNPFRTVGTSVSNESTEIDDTSFSVTENSTFVIEDSKENNVLELTQVIDEVKSPSSIPVLSETSRANDSDVSLSKANDISLTEGKLRTEDKSDEKEVQIEKTETNQTDNQEVVHDLIEEVEVSTVEKVEEVPTTEKVEKVPTTGKVEEVPTTGKAAEVPATEKVEVPITSKVEEIPIPLKAKEIVTTNKVEEVPTTDKAEEAVPEESASCDIKSSFVSEDSVTSSATFEHVEVAEDTKQSEASEEVSHSEVEEINFVSVDADKNSKTSTSSSIHIEEILLNRSVTDSIEESKNLLESKSSPDLDCTWTSTSFEVLSADKDTPSEVVELSHIKKELETNAQSPLKSVEEPECITAVPASVTVPSADIGAGDWKFPVSSEQETEVVKEPPTVLSELFEICSRQQKDLELSDEKFVDGKEFFTSPSKSANIKESVEYSPRKSSQTHLEETVLINSGPSEFAEFDQSITEEAEKILQEIINSSSELHEDSVRKSSSRRCSGVTQHSSSLSSAEVMADLRGVSNSTTAIADENSVNPFMSQSSLRRSPPPSGKRSPRSSSQGPSPCDSPRTKSKHSSVHLVKESSRDHASGDASPRSGKNSPDRRHSSNKAPSVEGSPKNSINSEINQSEAGPDIAEDAQVQSRDVFKDPAAFEYLNSVGNSHTVSDLRKESLYVKFDPLVGGISRTTDKSVPLPPAVEAKSINSMPILTSPVKDEQPDNTTPVKNPAISVIDKLISLSPSPLKSYITSPTKQPLVSPVKEPVPVPKQESIELNSSEVIANNARVMEELYLLRELLAAEDEKHKETVTHLEKEHETLRKHVENLQSLVRESEDREANLNKKVAEKTQAQKQMSIIMEEYEKTISRLVAEKEQERQAHELDKAALQKDRDAAMGHLANIEIAFSDLHKKYERSKTVIEGFKKNEEVLRASLAEYEATIRKQEQKYDVLKSHAMSQLENANQELDSVRRSQQAETAKLKAMLKKAEVKTSSLEEMLEQKVKENQELASICDELINKVGASE
ncbi:transforming acidic coiled-coil-containing protein 2-like isoform X2 [Periplaneta americana]|uniref:transforming acidic coiled-coil-containing protein 2-like isoform X2 n=1 Tax=Periplaneta americana TaxID=6978 RepID=UPI0037E816ED